MTTTVRTARLTAPAILLLTALHRSDTPTTEAGLYHALFAAGMSVDASAAIMQDLLTLGMVERIGPVAVDITEDGIDCVEAYAAKTSCQG